MKNVETIKQSNPGQAYNILKKLGARPGEWDGGSFQLPSHEQLNNLQKADKICEHFSKISREFPPLNKDLLPTHVITKISNPEAESLIPNLTEYEVYHQIKAASKPKSGVPGDIPRRLIMEFSPELADPVCKIYNSILKTAKQGTAEWPKQWKLEYGTPIKKINIPSTEDDLRVISLTPFLSKVFERFVVSWLRVYIRDKIDSKQFGDGKGNSTSHYLVELVNFILHNQDGDPPNAVLMATIDFSKAYNRQNHNILITKLSLLEVPGWLINLVMGYLKDREMVIRLNNETSSSRSLPGGGPQGGLLGALLFVILVNDCGFAPQAETIGQTVTRPNKKPGNRNLHLKYVDDYTILESLNLNKQFQINPSRQQPDNFRSRTGHILPPEESQVYNKIHETNEYAKLNDMKLNIDKTNFMLFNTSKTKDFDPNLQIEGTEINLVEHKKLLGVHLTSDLKWQKQVDEMTKKAYSRIWILKRLSHLGASEMDLIDTYNQQVRSLLEYCVPVWHPGLNNAQSKQIETVQNVCLQVIIGDAYQSSSSARKVLNLEKLNKRRNDLCHKFAQKSMDHPNHKKWFNISTQNNPNKRIKAPLLKPTFSRTVRFEKSPIPFLTSVINRNHTK